MAFQPVPEKGDVASIFTLLLKYGKELVGNVAVKNWLFPLVSVSPSICCTYPQCKAWGYPNVEPDEYVESLSVI